MNMKQRHPVCYGSIIEILGRKAYIVGIDDKGNPNAFLSVYARRCYYDEFNNIKFSNNWHIPDDDFYDKFRDGILATGKRHGLIDIRDWVNVKYPSGGGADYVRWGSTCGCGHSFYVDGYYGIPEEYNYARVSIEI